MKVLAIVVLVVTSVSAKGSGPYLPSGWRPEGPAFFLPSELSAKSNENSLKDTILEESEASGSEFLREYGPPKVVEVSQDITKQSLPEVATEQSFLIEAKFKQDEEITGKIQEVENAVTETEIASVTQGSVEKGTTIEEEIVTVTEEQQDVEDTINVRFAEQSLIQGKSINLEIDASVTATLEDQSSYDITTEQTIQGKSIDIGIEASLGETTENIVEATIANEETMSEQEEENINSEIKSAVEEKTLKEEEIKAIEVEVKNIADAVVQQEDNLKVTEVRTAEDVSGSLSQFPEGFLEYGPPGFREYGPPKGDEVLRTADEEKPSESQVIADNETRRRRFSPKFNRTPRRH